MSEEKTQPVESKELTPEEIKERRAKLIKFYKDQNEILALQSTYEKHKADISESIAREAMWTIRYAQMMAPPGPDDGSAGEDEGTKEEGSKKRHLKTV